MSTFVRLTAAVALAAMVLPLAALAQTTPINRVTAALDGEVVTIEGAVTDFRAAWSERAPNIVTVTDSSGSIPVVAWADVFDQIDPAPTVGAQVSITGVVNIYREQVQVRIDEPENLQVVAAVGAASAPEAPAPDATAAPSAPAAPMPDLPIDPLGSITPDREGETVTVQGVIENIRPSGNPRAPNTLTLRDESGTAPAVIWPEVFDSLSPTPAVGNQIRATGSVSVYRETAQVRCRDAQAIWILDDAGESVSVVPPSEAPAATQPSAPASGGPVEIAVSEIDGSTIGQTIVIEGAVVQMRAAWSDRAPNIITLSDGTSTIPVVAWSDLWSTLEREPVQGDRIRIQGEVSLYEARNEIQIRLQELEFVE